MANGYHLGFHRPSCILIHGCDAAAAAAAVVVVVVAAAATVGVVVVAAAAAADVWPLDGFYGDGGSARVVMAVNVFPSDAV